MNKLTFITFYTIDTIYEVTLKNLLLPSLQKFGLTNIIYAIENKGSWRVNTIEKPTIVLKSLETIDSDLIWTDADSEILKYPSLLFDIPKEFDIAVHFLSWEKHYGRKNDKGKYDMLDGTFLIRNNEKMRKFVKQWKANSTDIGVNHQKVLALMLTKRPDIKVFNLPWEYSYILTTPWGSPPAHPLKDEEIVIAHYQLSRRARKSLK